MVRNIEVSAASGIRNTILVLMLVMGLAYQSALRARADQNENTLEIMTQNVDAGTDFGYLTGQVAFLQGVDMTFQEINASNIPARAAQLASEIALSRNPPALVGLQEVTLLCGDFNADADTPNPTIEAILAGRFTDAWPTPGNLLASGSSTGCLWQSGEELGHNGEHPLSNC